MTAKARKPSQTSAGRRIAAQTKSRRTVAATSTRRAPKDAISILKADHAKVDAMFKQYENARSTQKESLVQAICQELKIHTQIEEEIFYPALRAAATKSDEVEDLLDEAKVEHNSAKSLIGELEAGSPSDELFDAKVKVLGEYIRHHVKEEHKDIFPIARKRLDVKELGEQLAQRKAELMDSMETGAAPRKTEDGILKLVRDATSSLRH